LAGAEMFQPLFNMKVIKMKTKLEHKSIKHRQFRLNISNITKMIDGKKYRCNGIVPKAMEEDLYRTFRKHGLALKVEPDDFDKNIIKLWSRSKK